MELDSSKGHIRLSERPRGSKKEESTITRFHSYPSDIIDEQVKEYKSGNLYKLSGKHPFRNWTVKKCHVVSNLFKYHNVKKSESKSSVINLVNSNPFVLNQNDSKTKKLKKYKCKTGMSWSETYIICFKPLKGSKKIKYFAVQKRDLDDWLSAIRKGIIGGDESDEHEVKFILDQDIELKSEVRSDSYNMTNLEELTDNEIDNRKNDSPETTNDLRTTKENPFSEMSDDDTRKGNRKYAYSLRTLRKMDISEFIFDDVAVHDEKLTAEEN